MGQVLFQRAQGAPRTGMEDMDEATADLILQLQLADLKEMEAASPGKQKAGELTDSQIAAQLFEENLATIRTTLSDHRMTRSIARAVHSDGYVVAEFVEEEELAHRDQALARRLHGGSAREEASADAVFSAEEIDAEILAKLAGLYVSEDWGQQLDRAARGEVTTSEERSSAESSSWAAGRSSANKDGHKHLNHRCDACREDKKFFDVVTAKCGHEYCRECLRELFSASLTDESLFPPRCCRQAISLSTANIFLTSEIKKQFGVKKIEFGTPNRTYCSQQACSAFITPDNIRDEVGVCAECLSQTCTVCKGAGHAGECPNDTSLQAVVELAREEGWQRCHSCRRMVELDTGCYHMTCRCKAEFCYLCGAQWKTCTCAQWDEDRLVNRAQQVVQRQAPQLAMNDPGRAAQVEALVEELREGHNCGHAQWRFIPGRLQCEECHHTLPHYIFECRQCRVRACNRCRRNRL